jgi:hypothetical protein
MRFWVEIRIAFDKMGKYLAEHKPVSSREEHFIITARNGSLTLSPNRPLLRGKGLKKRPPDFKLIQGITSNRSFLEDVVNAIMLHMEPPPAPKKKPTDREEPFKPIPRRRDQFADRSLVTLAERARLREEEQRKDKGKGIA